VNGPAATSVVLGALINSSRDADGMYGRGAGIAQQQRAYETTRMQDYEDEEEELGNMALRDE
jgi:hypothetical protein